MTTATPTRETAQERREQVLEAAIREFAEHGYQAAGTAAIARRAGISQPYIYALFPSKLELFLAAHDRVMTRLRALFEEAARGGGSPEAILARIGDSYHDLISDRYNLLLMLQAYAASGEPGIRARVSQAMRSMHRDIAAWSGASPLQLARFFASGMLVNVTTILELPEISEPLWLDHDLKP